MDQKKVHYEAIPKLMQLNDKDLEVVKMIMSYFIEKYASGPGPVPVQLPVPQNLQEIKHCDADVKLNPVPAPAANEPDVKPDPNPDVELVSVVPARPIPEPETSRPNPNPMDISQSLNGSSRKRATNIRYPPEVKRLTNQLRDKGESLNKIRCRIGTLYPKNGLPSRGSIQTWIKDRVRWLDNNNNDGAGIVDVDGKKMQIQQSKKTKSKPPPA